MKTRQNRAKYFVAVAVIITAIGFSEKTPPFQVGEKLTYDAFFNYIPAGTATLSVVGIDTLKQIPATQIRYKIKTGKMADRLYKVRDEINIWLDTESFITHKVTKSIREGSYRQKTTSSFYYRDSLAVCDKDTFRLRQPIRDPYSLLYYFRTLPLAVGQTYDFTTADNQTLIDFQVFVSGKETIRTSAGQFTCWIIKPFKEKNSLLKNQGEMIIWLSEDDRHLPVKIQVKMKFGSMLLKMKSVKIAH